MASSAFVAPLASRAVAFAIGRPFVETRRRWYRARRSLLGRPATLEAFIGVTDPYSALLVRRLDALRRGWSIDVSVRLVRAEDSGNARLQRRQHDYARTDATRLAAVLGESAPLDVPEERQQALEALIARRLSSDAAADSATAVAVVADLLGGADVEPAIAALKAVDLERGKLAVRDGCARLRALGHYQPGMLYFDGEWYWGVDRLGHLIDRLDSEFSVSDSTARSALLHDVAALGPPATATVTPPSGVALDFYYSFRSPYSYLAAERAYSMAARLGLSVRFKPVLPMVLRGLAVPRAKRWYILNDAAREARRHRIPFGRVTDPLPAAPALVSLGIAAEQAGRAREFIVAAGRAAWAEGRALAAPRELHRVAAQAGLGEPDVAAVLARRDAAMAEAERHREELYAEGLWGVPSFRCGRRSVWGQDRLGLLERTIRAGTDD